MSESQTKFEVLYDALLIKETKEYVLNVAGQKLMNEYYEFIRKQLSPWIEEDKVFTLLATINANHIASSKFKLANKIDTMTNGMTTHIDGNRWTFSDNDPLLKYIEVGGKND